MTAHPSRIHAVLTIILAALLLGGLTMVFVQHGSPFLANPLLVPWFGLSIALGFGLFFLNGVGLPLRGTVLSHLGYGTLAAIIGFDVQHLLNSRLLLWMGPAIALHGAGAMLLGFGSGFCQTFGKVVMTAVFIRRLRPENAREGLAIGLAVGLGFGLTEVFLITFQLIESGHQVTSLLGVIERAVAQGFHIYSGGLIALAFISRRFWLIGLVVIIHTLMDGLSVALAQSLSTYLLEIIFLVLALSTWTVYRLQCRVAEPPK
jgi:hypothetical protein